MDSGKSGILGASALPVEPSRAFQAWLKKMPLGLLGRTNDPFHLRFISAACAAIDTFLSRSSSSEAAATTAGFRRWQPRLPLQVFVFSCCCFGNGSVKPAFAACLSLWRIQLSR